MKKWIEQYCFTSKGGLNNRCCLDSWWINKGFQIEKAAIWNFSSCLNLDKPEQILWHCYNETLEQGKCEVCFGPTKFKSFKDGYYKNCSVQCSGKNKKRIEKIQEKIDYKEIQKKVKATNLEKYGNEIFFKTETAKEKISNTKLNRYGDKKYNNIEKNKQTCLEKYGIDTLFNDKKFQKKIIKLKWDKYPNGIINWSKKSGPEEELKMWINSFGFNFNTNRSILNGREIDLFDEELMIGIEYCGLYWHSSEFKDKNYHYKKYKDCLDKGIQLITIFEDEWIYRKDQIKQFLKAKLGVFDERIYARKCEVKEIYKKEAYLFFEKNHIQGRPNNIDSAFSLYYNNEIVGCVSYGKHHRNSRDIVLNRLAFKSGTQIIGGASKLFNNSVSNYEKVISWSDNRYTNGNIYKFLGFSLDKNLNPDYSYVLNDNSFMRKSKQSSRKKLNNIPLHITEENFYKEKQIFKIYDCGKKRWSFTFGN